ncbi:hypothetical protein O978_12985 [Mycobacterium avium subsp. paratuberculosis 10-5864]|nr:hypothetical protein O978_12985 [Mycobacterium avium subsp. paratuberculosis 10-5864]
MGDKENVMQVDPVKLVPQLRVGVGETPGVAQPVAHVVHQHVDPAVAVQHGPRKVGDLGRVSHVGGDGMRGSAGRRDRRGGFVGEFGVDVGDDDMRTVFGEKPRGGRADTAATTGHHRHPVAQQRIKVLGLRHRSYLRPLAEIGDNQAGRQASDTHLSPRQTVMNPTFAARTSPVSPSP